MRNSKLLIAAAIGGAAMLAIEGAVGLGVVNFGLYDPSAATTHPPIVRRLVHRTMVQSVRRLASGDNEAQVSAKDIEAGLCIYRDHCSACHGAPGLAREPWANGLYPTPPYLIDSRLRWSGSQLQWIIRNGVKMTAMPAWEASMGNGDIRDVAAFVEALPKVPPMQYQQASRQCRPGAPKL